MPALRVRLEVRCRPAEGAEAVAAGDVGDVAHDRRGGGVAAGAGAGEDQLPDEIGLDRDRVGHPVDAGDCRGFRHHRRVHPLLDAGVGPAGDAEELDAVTELVCRLDVGRRHAGNALGIDGAGVDLGAEGDRGEESEPSWAVSYPSISKLGSASA